MENKPEIRKMPKKTIIIITVMILIIFSVFLFLRFTKEEKLTEILTTLGHNNITELSVINKLSVEDKETKYKSKVYKVTFFDKNLNKQCIGFVHFGRNNQYSKDIDCK